MESVTVEALVESGFELDVFLRFLWVFAKAANKEIPPLVDWLSEFDVPPIEFALSSLGQVMDLLMGTVASSVKGKN